VISLLKPDEDAVGLDTKWRSLDPDDALSKDLEALRPSSPVKITEGLTSPGACDGYVLGSAGWGGEGIMGDLALCGVFWECVDDEDAVRTCLGVYSEN
jgi:hypothetical protein